MKILKHYLILGLLLVTISVIEGSCSFTKKKEKENYLILVDENTVLDWSGQDSITPVNSDSEEKRVNQPFAYCISVLPTVSVPFHGTDTNVMDNPISCFRCDTPSDFEEYLQYLSAIPENFLRHGSEYWSEYCTSQLRIIQGMKVEGTPILFYMSVVVGYNKTRSLVFAILDSLGQEISSKILVTDDENLKAYKGKKGLYKTSSYTVTPTSIEIDVFSGSEDYEYAKTLEEHLIYRINPDGKIELVEK